MSVLRPLVSRAALLAVLVLPAMPAPAAAVGFGVRGGASLDPDQFVFGGHLDALTKRGLIRPVLPILEVGVGESRTAVSLLADVLLRPDLRLKRWEIFGGLEAGPRYTTFDGGNDVTQLAWLVVLGTERERLGFQVKINLGNAPDVELLGTYRLGGH